MMGDAKHTPIPTWSNPLWHGKWRIYLTDPLPPIPTWGQFEFSYLHDDYDGAEDAGDNRGGHAPTVEACIAEIDEWEADHSVTHARAAIAETEARS